jgi:hypothetical protein
MAPSLRKAFYTNYKYLGLYCIKNVILICFTHRSDFNIVHSIHWPQGMASQKVSGIIKIINSKTGFPEKQIFWYRL